jgi:hypothetical protein
MDTSGSSKRRKISDHTLKKWKIRLGFLIVNHETELDGMGRNGTEQDETGQDGAGRSGADAGVPAY